MKEQRIFYYCSATLGCLPVTNSSCTEHDVVGQAAVSKNAANKNGKTFASATMKSTNSEIKTIINPRNASKDVMIIPSRD